MKLDEIKRISDAATRGSWMCNFYASDFCVRPGKSATEEDFCFIDMARNVIPKLIAVAEAAKAYLGSPEGHFQAFKDLQKALEELEKD